MDISDQKQAAYGYNNISGRDAEQQAKWQSHIEMEQAAHAAMCSSPSPRGMLDVSIDGLAHSIGEAHSVVGTLAQRLQMVLQPEAPTPVGAGLNGSNSPPASEAVHKLQLLRREVEMLIGRLNSMSSRLDT